MTHGLITKCHATLFIEHILDLYGLWSIATIVKFLIFSVLKDVSFV